MENTSMNHTSSFPRCPSLDTYTLYLPRTLYNEEFFKTFIVINAVLALISSCNNFVIIYTIARTSSLRVPSNILILNLAISDFVVAVIVQPSYCVFKFFEMKRSFSLYCIFGLVCNYSVWTIAPVSLMTITAIAGDRFLAVYLHLRYQELVTTKRYCILIGCIWVVGQVTCIARMHFVHESFTRITGLLAFVFIILVNLFFFVKISRVIRRHSLQIQAQQQSVQQSIDMPTYKKSVNTMYYVIGAFLICYVPFIAVMIVYSDIHKKATQYILMLTIVAETLVMFNGVLNPIIYCWRVQEIRLAAMKLFRRSCSNP